MSSLFSVAEAREHLLSKLSKVGRTEIGLDLAHGRVLAEKIISPLDLPPFENSQMDGYAVRAADVVGASTAQPVVLKVIGDIPAGANPQFSVSAGETARIMTGAPVPAGADLVIPVENTDQNERSEGAAFHDRVAIYQGGNPGDFIRPIGQDIRQGQEVLSPGKRIRPQEIGFMAMLGITRIPVFKMPRIGLLSSGNELLAIDQPLTPGKIRDANSFMLESLVQDEKADVIRLGIAADNELSVRERLDRAVSEKCDMIVSSAGVSVGAFDFVRKVIEQRGSIEFWRVNIRPGKPIAFGIYQDIPLIGLAGNPVSAFVGFEVFVRPALQMLSGLDPTPRMAVKVKISEPLESDGRESYLRCQVMDQNGDLSVQLTGAHQGSGNLFSLVQANALLIVPSGVKSLPAGSILDAWMLSQ